MPCPAGAGAGRLQEAASDARAVPSPRALEGSRRELGSAAAARLQRASRARWHRIGRLRCWGESHAARDGRWAHWAVMTALLGLCVCYRCVWCPEWIAPCVKVGLFQIKR